MALTNSLPVDGPYPTPVGKKLSLVGDGTNSEQKPDVGITFEDGAMKIEHGDGSVTIDFNGGDEPEDEVDGENLAMSLGDGRLAEIAEDLLEGIQADIDSRKEWLETRALGMGLLGLKLEKPRSPDSQAPLEGMSTVRHPLLLEATVSFQATARAELLPASGPVKVRNDTPMPPRNVVANQIQETNAQQQLMDSLQGKDELAEALEKDFNHYLTAVATEYIPDTDRMLFYIGFGGDGFKKVYHCPLRRRPVSESVDAEYLIVSDAATDLQNCPRITHWIKMRKSVLRRMQLLGVYRDVELYPPQRTETNAVEQRKDEIAGQNRNQIRPEDRDRDIYECYCELDINEFAPRQFKGKKLPLPYRVTLDRESRQILDIRRNWDEDDEECMAKQFFVQFPFIRGLGFYGLGFIHLLGNTTTALTAAWRLMLDNGMFSNFPGFLYAKQMGRQNSNIFRVPPGGGVPVDVGAQQSIKDAVMPFPYKDTGPSFVAFTQHVEEVGKQLAQTANIQVGEGKQDAPVGTTLALIEQASKVLDSAHKRLHAAQAEEFRLLKERFREDPEAFWRHNKNTTIEWEKDQFVQALEDCNLVPVADPNNPTMMHRAAKAQIVKTLQAGNPAIYDAVAVDMWVLRTCDIDPAGMFNANPTPPPPDPRMEAIQQKAQQTQQQSQIDAQANQQKTQLGFAQLQDKQKDRDSKHQLELLKLQQQQEKTRMEQVIHAQDAQREMAQTQHEMQMDAAQRQAEMQHDAARHQMEMTQQAQQHAQEMQMRQHEAAINAQQAQTEAEGGRIQMEQQIHHDHQRHQMEMTRAQQEHEIGLQHSQELGQAKVEAAKKMAAAKPAATTKGTKETGNGESS